MLRAAGFYAAEVEGSIEGDAPPFDVTVTVTPGPLYELSAYEIAYRGEGNEELPRDPAALGLAIGGPARSAPIAAAETALLERLAELGRPRAAVLDRRYLVDHEARSLTGRLEVDPGPELAFGPLAIAGLDRVEESYIRRLVPWEEGGRYDSRQVAVLEERLRDSGLFDSFAVEAGAPDAENRLPQTLRLAEAKRRSIGAGGGYASDEGPFGEAFWEHRNFFGEGERLTVTLGASALEQSLTAEGRKPNFLRLDQALVAESALTRADNEAFEEESLRIFGGLERRLSETW
ncbi:MAG: autotransporter assembly complex protein TamA, partial [Burkholderiales bacterium]